MFNAKEYYKTYSPKYQQTEKYKAARHKINRSLKQIFRVRRATAIKRKITWALTFDEFVSLRTGNCTYCEGPLPEAGIGLDRVDNAKGYEKNNLVPCCAICNAVRGDKFSSDEMRSTLGPAIKKLREARVSKSTSPILYQKASSL